MCLEWSEGEFTPVSNLGKAPCVLNRENLMDTSEWESAFSHSRRRGDESDLSGLALIQRRGDESIYVFKS